MEVGVFLAALMLVFLTSLAISALGTGTFFSLLSISAVLGGILLYTRDTGSELRKRLVERLVDR
jgi:hypothetical protein